MVEIFLFVFRWLTVFSSDKKMLRRVGKHVFVLSLHIIWHTKEDDIFLSSKLHFTKFLKFFYLCE